MNRILIIDDEIKLMDLLARILTLEGYKVFKAEKAKNGLEMLENQEVELIITDVKLPDANGVQLTQILKSKYPMTEIIVMTAYGTIADGVEAMRNGAFDYLVKGDHNEQMLLVINKAIEKANLKRKVALLEKKVKQGAVFADLIGESPLFKQAIDLAQKVAHTDTNVLLTGETGTGKELFAEAIHNESERRDHPLVAINCAAIPKDLLESELFGYKKGAFSGALSDKKGLLEEANGGTLFLDEIGEMPLDLQAKLLRVLDSQQFTKLGETKSTKVNLRLISATNRDLAQYIQQAKFRADLYYRLTVIELHLPALRERKTDIPLLINYFIDLYSKKFKQHISGAEADFIRALESYTFPGNLREIRNIIERAIILCSGNTLTINTLTPEIIHNYWPKNSVTETEDSSLSSMEKKHISQMLAQVNGNKTKAAEVLGIALTTLYRKMQEYGIE
jgi:DNA-binding NtrC family response regulator